MCLICCVVPPAELSSSLRCGALTSTGWRCPRSHVDSLHHSNFLKNFSCYFFFYYLFNSELQTGDDDILATQTHSSINPSVKCAVAARSTLASWANKQEAVGVVTWCCFLAFIQEVFDWSFVTGGVHQPIRGGR